MRIRCLHLGRRSDPRLIRRRLYTGATVLLCGTLASASCASSRCGLDPIEHTLEVTAKDSVSGTLVANATVTAVAQLDTMTKLVGSDVSQYPVFFISSGGTYTISITAPGYAAWSKTITVSGVPSNCKPIVLASLTALMQK